MECRFRSHAGVEASNLIWEPCKLCAKSLCLSERLLDIACVLRFTQDSISPTFRDGRPIFQLMNDLNSKAVPWLQQTLHGLYPSHFAAVSSENARLVASVHCCH